MSGESQDRGRSGRADRPTLPVGLSGRPYRYPAAREKHPGLGLPTPSPAPGQNSGEGLDDSVPVPEEPRRSNFIRFFPLISHCDDEFLSLIHI